MRPLALALHLAPALALALLVASEGRAQGACLAPTAVEAEVVDLVNLERAAADLAPLAIDARLVAAAVRHSEDMRDGCFLSHTGSDGSSAGSRIRDAGYDAWSGETVGAGQATPEAIVTGWMNSSGHRAILLDPRSTHIGVGHAEGADVCVLSPYGIRIRPVFWTADFGRASGPALPPGECGGGAPACSDGVDNDGDGRIDFAEELASFDCLSEQDPSEGPDCSDGVDNNGNGLVDHPEDPTCASPEQWMEGPACGLGFELALLLPLLAGARRLRLRRRAGA